MSVREHKVATRPAACEMTVRVEAAVGKRGDLLGSLAGLLVDLDGRDGKQHVEPTAVDGNGELNHASR